MKSSCKLGDVKWQMLNGPGITSLGLYKDGSRAVAVSMIV